MKTLSAIAITILFSIGAFAQTVPTYDISMPLLLREKFYTSFIETQKNFNSIEKNEALKMWKELQNKQTPKFNYFLNKKLKPYIKSQLIIDWYAHYQMTGQTQKSAEVLSSYFYSLAAFLWEYSENPRISEASREKTAAQSAVALAFQSAQQAETCLYRKTAAAGKSFEALSTILNECAQANAGIIQMLQLASQLMNTRGYSGPNQVLSLTGFTPGNKVEQITQNNYEAEFIHYMAPMTSTVQKLYGNMKVSDFKARMVTRAAALTSSFTVEEGFPLKPSDHLNWILTKKDGQKNIYGSIFKSIENAQQTVFIDVFFLGGSVGASLAKHLIEQVQKKPNLWVYIINDRFNPLAYELEMAPVYNYLRAYSEKFPEDRLMIMTPRIDLKRTAFPPIAEAIINDQSLKYILSDRSQEDLKLQLGFYPKGKSDHSKVMVIDGKNKIGGTAYVGSKNFTDSSGAVAYDEVTKIEGPAVPIILDSYYYDLLEALKEASRLAPEYVSDLLKKNAKASIAQLLAPIDILNRYADRSTVDFKWPMLGHATISIGENNVYGTIRTALPQDIALINTAEKQIIISDQYLYDPLFLRALIEKIQKNQNLKVYIMLAAMEDQLDSAKKFAHIPNISYIDTLKATGQVKAKWKKIPEVELVALKEVSQKYGVKLAHDYHLKSISVDGVTADQAGLCRQRFQSTKELINTMIKIPALVSGSANKDVLTMTGGFREFQVVVYDREATIAHDCLFWERFNDADQSKEIRNETMNLPTELIKAGIDEKMFNQIIRNAINISYGTITGYFVD